MGIENQLVSRVKMQPELVNDYNYVYYMDENEIYEHELNSKNMEIMLIKLGFGLFISVGLIWCLYIFCLRRGDEMRMIRIVNTNREIPIVNSYNEPFRLGQVRRF